MKQTDQVMQRLEQHTALTQPTRDLSERIETLTAEIHGNLVGRQ